MNTKKLGLGIFREQFKWSLWYTFTILLIYIAVLLYQVYVEAIEFTDFSMFSNGSSSIFMLIIGILSTYSFFDYFAKQGITRRNFFKATIGASVLLAIAISITIFLMNGLLHLLVQNAGWDITWTNEVSPTGFFSFIEVFISYTLIHALYYLIGWMIGLGYYRLGWVLGTLAFVPLALIFVNITGLLWGLSHINFFPHLSLQSFPLSIVLSIVFAGILLYINHRLIKEITVVM